MLHAAVAASTYLPWPMARPKLEATRQHIQPVPGLHQRGQHQTCSYCTAQHGSAWSVSHRITSFLPGSSSHLTIQSYTSSTAQGGGGSFRNRKPIGEVGCCESRMAERSHWWTDRWLRSPLFLSLSLSLSFSFSDYLPTYLPNLSIYQSINLSISLSLCVCLSICLSASLKTKLFCETSSIFELDNIKNQAILRDFLQKWKVECCQVIRSAAPVTQNHLSKPTDLMLQNGTPLRKSAPWPPNISDEHVFCTAPATENASLQILFKCPTPAILFGNATKYHKTLTFCFFWQGAQSLAPATRNDIWTSKSGPNPWCF